MEVTLFKAKYGEQMGVGTVEVSKEEKDEIDERKVKDRAKSFHDNINKIYITFACMKTKNLVERLFWKSRYSKILRLSQLCMKDNMIALDELKQGNKIQSGKWGSLYIVENPAPNSIFYVEEFEDK